MAGMKRACVSLLQISCLFILLIATASQPHAAEPGSGQPQLPDRIDVLAIDRYLTWFVQKKDRVGLSVTLVQDGRIVLSKGYGKRSLETSAPVDANTIFGIGSVSKQFTCAAVFLLADEGRLSVKDPISKYYPNLTRASDITLLDLMHHVSGYPDYYPLDFLDRRMMQPIEPDALLQQYAGGKLDFEPGTRWSYSNTGFILLARVVERVSGMKFGDFLQQRIFSPLGMKQSLYEPSPKDPRVAAGYKTFALSKPFVVPPESPGWLGGAGAVASTTYDLALWDLALMDRRLLKAASWDVFTEPRHLQSGKSTDYACGIGARQRSGRLTLTHSGSVSGFNAWNGFIPSTRSALALTCNREGGLDDLPGRLFDLLLREPSNAPIVTGPDATEVSKELFNAFRTGKVDRKRFADEFNHFLTPTRVRETAAQLKRFGSPSKAELLSRGERGGLEVTTVRLESKAGPLTTLMYRRPDGIVEQFFVQGE